MRGRSEVIRVRERIKQCTRYGWPPFLLPWLSLSFPRQVKAVEKGPLPEREIGLVSLLRKVLLFFFTFQKLTLSTNTCLGKRSASLDHQGNPHDENLDVC